VSLLTLAGDRNHISTAMGRFDCIFKQFRIECSA
jgi:hypothetical protein